MMSERKKRKLSAMSSSEKIALDVAPGEQENDSVYDFLYHDVRRVGSFLAQFDDAGHLQQVTQSDKVIRGAKRGWKFKLAGGVEQMGNGELSGERTPLEGGSEESERLYDPLWTNARTLLDYLAHRDMIQRELGTAQVGQFVLVQGQIMLLDLAMLKGAWDKGPIQKMIRAGAQAEAQSNQPRPSRAERRANRPSVGSNQQDGLAETDMLLSLLTLLPHSTQARLIGTDVNVWCSLDVESIVGQSSDLTLKHGALIPGDWFMLGVLDAYPYDPDFRNAEGESESELFGRIAETGIGQLVARLAPIVRQVMGRPPSAFGMTPLLIFREIAGRALSQAESSEDKTA